MTTARAARNAMPSVALVPRRAAVPLKAVLQEEEAQEVALREAVPQEVRHRETQVVVAVAPAATRMTTIHRAVVAEEDYLKNRSAVVVNLKRVTPDQAKRIVDFLYGTIYAIGGDLQKLGGGIFLCTPNNVNVEGQISEDANKTGAKKKEEKEESDEDFF